MTGAEFCPSCGAYTLGGAFCTSCGAALPSAPVALASTPPPTVPAGAEPDALAGRACPYCRFPLKGATEIVECRSCHAVHHADCWFENSGCAINGCVTPADAPPPVAAPVQPTQSATVAAAWGAVNAAAPPFAPAPRSRPQTSARTVLLVLLAVLVPAGGGVALYVALSKSHRDASASTGGNPTSGGGGGTTPGTGVLPNVPREQMRRDIQQLLLTWHQDIRNGDTAAAWQLLTPRKQGQQMRERGGYAAWENWQLDLGQKLDPSGIHVSIRRLDPSSGVATVLVTGMAYSNPHSTCSEWSGITWVRYEAGAWRYEPGWAVTHARTAYWKPRATRTLGWGC